MNRLPEWTLILCNQHTLTNSICLSFFVSVPSYTPFFTSISPLASISLFTLITALIFLFTHISFTYISTLMPTSLFVCFFRNVAFCVYVRSCPTQYFYVYSSLTYRRQSVTYSHLHSNSILVYFFIISLSQHHHFLTVFRLANGDYRLCWSSYNSHHTQLTFHCILYSAI